MKASPATEWCGYAPGYFPDNVTSYSAPNPSTFVINFNKAYNPEWVLYSELSQITPMPLAWDRTSLSQPAPHEPTTAICRTRRSPAPRRSTSSSTRQSKQLGSWASSPLWSVVDGPFKLQSFNTDGQVTLVPNPQLLGLAEGRRSPSSSSCRSRARRRSTTQIRSGGPSAITIANIPSQYAPAALLAGGRGLRRQQGGELLVQLLPAELQLERNHVARRRAGRYIFRQTVLPRGAPAPGRPAGLDQRVPVPHGQPDLRPDSVVAAEPARQHREHLDEPVRVLGLDGASSC